jgi:hypothetical protein
VVAGILRFISAAGRLLACTRTGKAIDLVRTTVKSFVALSVRDRSSGNSPATIAHNSRQTTAVRRILPTSVRLRAIVKSAALYTSRKQWQSVKVTGGLNRKFQQCLIDNITTSASLRPE